MRAAAVLLIVALGITSAHAQPPDDPSRFQLGIWADGQRASSCVTGPPGATFDLAAFGWVPGDLGLAYITFRFDFPANVDLSGPRTFHPDVLDVIITDFADGTQEWNLLVTACHSGWVWIFTQEVALLDEQTSHIGIVADRCWMRDCDFTLNEVGLLSEIGVNDPGCGGVPAARSTWGALKGLFR